MNREVTSTSNTAQPVTESDLNRRRPWRLLLLVAAVVVVSLLHYQTSPSHAHFHVVYQRLYYLPILLGAVFYGVTGGVGLAIVTAVLYIPHIVTDWGHEPLYQSIQFAEIVMFLVFGVVAGVLIDRVRGEREGHRRTAEELARAYEKLQATFERMRLLDRLSALGALSAGLAHEIRTPLGSISGSIEIVEAAIPEGDERREFVGILKKEIQRLSNLVSRHLDMLRPARPERGPHCLEETIRTVVELTRKQAARQDVTLEVTVQDDLPSILVDGYQIRQAVLNLLINAIQALPNGGKVELHVLREGDRIELHVEDDGPGLSEEILNRAFEPFFTTRDAGTGLGLSIAFQIATQHGGDLRVENRPEGGARFTLSLPVDSDRADSPPSSADPEPRP